MKVVNCKCGAGQPEIVESTMFPSDNYPYGYKCYKCGLFTNWHHTADKALSAWNSLNTDQHGQQLTEQKITWTEWDGDVEHLPPERTRLVCKTISEVSGKNCYYTGAWKMQDGYPCIVFYYVPFSGEEIQIRFIRMEKGDQFAVVGG